LTSPEFFSGDEILPLGVKGSSNPTKDVFGGNKKSYKIAIILVKKHGNRHM
jgi:hypothetical protein